MSVILISEDNHGLIGVAKDYKSAIKFLINENWIRETDEVWDEEYKQYVKLKEIFGESVLDQISDNWDLETFNDYFCDNFLLREERVYE